MSQLSEQMKLKYRNYGKPWTSELDRLLTMLFKEGKTVEQLMLYFGRNEGGILARLQELYLVDPYSISATPKYDPKLILKKEQELKGKVEKINREIEDKYEELGVVQKQLLKLVQKKNAQNLEYETMDRALRVAVEDMISNGWYENVDQALNSLMNRIR